jgi:DNA-binding SARP family transcriptional activator
VVPRQVIRSGCRATALTRRRRTDVIDLSILGSPRLTGATGNHLRSVLSQPKRLAVLSYLAVHAPDRFLRRDRLLALFWPESDEKHARSSLSESLSRLRKSLGPDSLLARGSDEVGLNSRVISSDVVLFELAVSEGRLRDAAELYRGPLLEHFILDNGPGFDQWLESTRARLAGSAIDLLGRLSDDAFKTGDARATLWAERAAAIAPLDGTSVLRLMRVMAAAGHRAAAIREYERFRARLGTELGMEPSVEVEDFMRSIRDGNGLGLPASRGNGSAGNGRGRSAEEVPLVSAEPIQVEERTASAGSGPLQAVGVLNDADSEQGLRGGSGSRILVRALTIALAGTLTALAIMWSGSRSAAVPPVRRFTLPLTREAGVYLGGRTDTQTGRPMATSLTFSPSGDLLAYAARDTADSKIYLRRLDQEAGDPVPGTEGASSPFFSPDGASVGFFVGPALKRLSVADGEVETVVMDARIPGAWGDRSPNPRGATWGDDGTIIYGAPEGLYQVAAHGGEPRIVLAADSIEGGFPRFHQPQMLPGSRKVLLHVQPSIEPEDAHIVALDLATGALTPIVMNAMHPRYLSGYLIFMREGTLMAAPFNRRRLEVSSPPARLLEDVMHSVFNGNSGYETGAAQFTISTSGHLAYVAGGVMPATLRVPMRITRDGGMEPLGMEPAEYGTFRVSPDGNRIVYHTRRGVSRYELWIHDLTRGVSNHIGSGGAAVWSPDGSSVAFQSDREGSVAIYRMPADQSREVERWTPSSEPQSIQSWSSKGDLAFIQGGDIWTVSRDGVPAPFFESEAIERDATFSPDGKWLMYSSRRTGSSEVYVRPYPGPGPETRISEERGINPVWARDGRTIYYIRQKGEEHHHYLMSVAVNPSATFIAGRPTRLMEWQGTSRIPSGRYDMFPDGSFIDVDMERETQRGDGQEPWFNVPPFVRPASMFRERGATELHVFLNFAEELKGRFPN